LILAIVVALGTEKKGRSFLKVEAE